jgi:hypothetical protein
MYEEYQRIIYVLLSWTISITLIINFRCELFYDKLIGINGYQFTLITLSILLLLLPFLEKIKIAGIELTNRIAQATTKVERKIEEVEQKISQKDIVNFRTTHDIDVENEIIFTDDDDAKWKMVKLRIEIEKSLRYVLNKRSSIKQTKSLNVKYYSLNKLFSMYINEYPDTKEMDDTFKLFSHLANAAVHGQKLSFEQAEKGAKLGLNILRYIKLKNIESSSRQE